MPIRLPTLVFWAAAAAALAALFGPPPQATAWTALAGIALVLAYLLWRLGLRRERSLAVAAVAAQARLEAPALLEAATRVARCVATAASFEAGLFGVGEVLRCELGARAVAMHRIEGVEPGGGAPTVRLVTLLDANGAHGAVQTLRGGPLGRAVAAAAPQGEPPGPFVLPVLVDGGVVGLVELGELALEVEQEALQSLFGLVAFELAALHRRCPAVTSCRAAVAAGSEDALRSAPLVVDNSPGHDAGAPAGDALAGTPSADEPRPEDAPRDMPIRPLRHPLLATPDGAGTPGGGAAGATRLDEAALARLRELDPSGASRLLERVLQAFETSVARLLPQLEQARAAGDLAGIRHVAHTLKSSSASIGALELSQQCAEIEAAARQGVHEGLEPRLEAMVVELGKVRAALGALLNG